jgi:RIP metalloprotease RseP
MSEPNEPTAPVAAGRDLREGPIPLVIFVALIVYLGVSVGWWVVAAIVGIIIMIFLHELGHYVAAKRGGMKVTEFFLGFGPRLWSMTRGETTYGLKAIPLGAYVRIIGMSNLEEVDPADEARTYRQASYPRRLAVAVAGSTMHFVQAFLLLVLVYGVIGVSTDTWRIREVTAGSPAAMAGLESGDRLVRVGETPVDDFDALAVALVGTNGADTPIVYERDGVERTASAVIAERFNVSIETAIVGLESRDRLVSVDGAEVRTYAQLATMVAPGSTYRIEVVRRDQLCAVDATVTALPEPDVVTSGFLGVAPQFGTARTSPQLAVGRSLGDFGRVSTAAVSGIARFFQPSSIKSFVTDSVSAPQADASECRSLSDEENRILSIYGFGRVASDAGRNGADEFVALFALFNIFIGIFNLMPVLPFDGGHVVVATYERLRSRRGKRHFADLSKLMPLTYAVAALLVFLGVLALFRDIIQPPSLG